LITPNRYTDGCGGVIVPNTSLRTCAVGLSGSCKLNQNKD